MEIVLSGSRPTGYVHLGNYLGAIRNYVRMQDNYKAYFFVADYHSLTTHLDTSELQKNTKLLLANYIGCGLDPNRCTIYIQSQVPEISELFCIFNNLAYKGELEKVPTFKDKVRDQESKNKTISAGLLTYPVLMSVDILIHRAHKVPVGKDQESHLEITRNLAQRFNYYTNSQFFPEPQGFKFGEDQLRVPSLDNTGKMSKSAANPNSAIFMTDDSELIRKKVMRAVTDSGPTQPNQTKPDAIGNLFDLMKLVSSQNTYDHFETTWNNCTIRYGDLKKQLAEDMAAFISPFREKILDLEQNVPYLQKVINEGAEKARHSASETLQGAKKLLRFNYFT